VAIGCKRRLLFYDSIKINMLKKNGNELFTFPMLYNTYLYNQIKNNMKKFILMALTVLLSTGMVMADKKCCKNETKCTKTACAKKHSAKKACCANKTAATSKKACSANKTAATTSCSGTAKKACCKNKAKAEVAEVEVNEDGTVKE
jgi:hypothetical protein